MLNCRWALDQAGYAENCPHAVPNDVCSPCTNHKYFVFFFHAPIFFLNRKPFKSIGSMLGVSTSKELWLWSRILIVAVEETPWIWCWVSLPRYSLSRVLTVQTYGKIVTTALVTITLVTNRLILFVITSIEAPAGLPNFIIFFLVNLALACRWCNLPKRLKNVR